jgi:hypothetical protein
MINASHYCVSNVLQTHSNQFNMVLTLKQTNEHRIEPRNNHRHLQPILFFFERAKNTQWRKGNVYNKCTNGFINVET